MEDVSIQNIPNEQEKNSSDSNHRMRENGGDNYSTFKKLFSISIAIIIISIALKKVFPIALYLWTGAQIDSPGHLELIISHMASSNLLGVFVGILNTLLPACVPFLNYSIAKKLSKYGNTITAVILTLTAAGLSAMIIIFMVLDYAVIHKYPNERACYEEKMTKIIDRLELKINEAVVEIQILPKRLVNYDAIYALFLPILVKENNSGNVINFINKRAFLKLLKESGPEGVIRQFVVKGVEKLWDKQEKNEKPPFKNPYFPKYMKYLNIIKQDYYNCEYTEETKVFLTNTLSNEILKRLNLPQISRGQKQETCSYISDNNFISIDKDMETELLISINSDISNYIDNVKLKGSIAERIEEVLSPGKTRYFLYCYGKLTAVLENDKEFSFEVYSKNPHPRVRIESAREDAQEQLRLQVREILLKKY